MTIILGSLYTVPIFLATSSGEPITAASGVDVIIKKGDGTISTRDGSSGFREADQQNLPGVYLLDLLTSDTSVTGNLYYYVRAAGANTFEGHVQVISPSTNQMLGMLFSGLT